MALQEYEKNNLYEKSNGHIYIQTLGSFSVRRGDHVLSAESQKSQKMWELFKYIIANHGKNILPGTIQETLWPDQDYDFSDKAFRTMIFRLRQTLKKGLEEESPIQPIIFSHGCYSWNPEIEYTLDVEEFEKSYLAARHNKGNNLQKALENYQTMMELYKGSYLSESMYTEWTIPLRNHYRHLYLQAMGDYCSLLKEQGDFAAIIEVSRNVILLEPLEEDFHLSLMEALLKKGKVKDARQDYEYITAKLYQELGLRPSAEMRSIYSKITARDNTTRADIDTVQEAMSENRNENMNESTEVEGEGPFFCDKKTFQAIYDLEKRRAERSGQSVFIGLLTLETINEAAAETELKKEALAALKNVIKRSLRKGDVCAPWSDWQLILILPSINMEQTKMVLGRLERAFRERIKQEDVVLRVRHQPILANFIIK